MSPLIAVYKGHVHRGYIYIYISIYLTDRLPRNRRIWGHMKCTVKALRLGLQGTLEVENPLKEHILNPKKRQSFRVIFFRKNWEI